MRNQFRARILRAIRQKIADESSTCISAACDELVATDHRRKVHEICASIKKEVIADLDGAPLAAYLRQHGDLATPHEARLNWLDDAIKRCATMPDQHYVDS